MRSVAGVGAWARTLALCATLVLCGCREPLYTQLTEQEANDIVAVLARAGIDGAKSPQGDKGWGVEVYPSDIATAVDALNAAGLPRNRFSSLGEMFKREGIVATPTEERVRFMHGVSQELSQTLTGIDGVIAARVHLVIPQNDPLSDKSKVSSASVFVKHRIDVDLQPMLPAIKSLVLRSVEGLTFDTVFVSFFPAERPSPVQQARTRVPLFGLEFSRPVAAWLNPLLAILAAGSIALAAYVLLRHRQRLRDDMRALFSSGDPPPRRNPRPEAGSAIVASREQTGVERG